MAQPNQIENPNLYKIASLGSSAREINETLLVLQRIEVPFDFKLLKVRTSLIYQGNFDENNSFILKEKSNHLKGQEQIYELSKEGFTKNGEKCDHPDEIHKVSQYLDLYKLALKNHKEHNRVALDTL